MPDLRLGQLFVGTQLAALDAHLLTDEGGEDDEGDALEALTVLDELGQPVAVHLGHLDVRDDQGHMAREVRVPGKLVEVVPELPAVGVHPEVHVPRLAQGVLDHLREEDGVLRDPDGALIPGPGAHGVDLLHLD